jgi:hypothetical protein
VELTLWSFVPGIKLRKSLKELPFSKIERFLKMLFSENLS